jgi:hypothetical protein
MGEDEHHTEPGEISMIVYYLLDGKGIRQS